VHHGRGSPCCPWNPGCPRRKALVRRRGGRDGGCLLLELATDDIGEYLIVLVTVRAEPRVGGDAVLVEDTEGTEALVARIAVAEQSSVIQFG